MAQSPSAAQVVEIAVNLDDLSGEVIAAAADALRGDGALDVWTTPITMKHGRPGVCLSLLCREADRERLARRVVERTGSFGLRYRTWDRLELDRRHETVATDFGEVRIKVGSLDGRDVTAKVEFADAADLARRHDVSPRRVIQAAMCAWCGNPHADGAGGRP